MMTRKSVNTIFNLRVQMKNENERLHGKEYKEFQLLPHLIRSISSFTPVKRSSVRIWNKLVLHVTDNQIVGVFTRPCDRTSRVITNYKTEILLYNICLGNLDDKSYLPAFWKVIEVFVSWYLQKLCRNYVFKLRWLIALHTI